MKQVEERYISLLTDFGFKRIFGTAMNKDLLILWSMPGIASASVIWVLLTLT